MNCVKVNFKGSTGEYSYKTRFNLIVGAEYDIITDNRTTYSNPVIVKKIAKYSKNNGAIREITSIQIKNAPSIRKDQIKNVFFTKDKGVTCVLWQDGTRTIVKCQNGEAFDKEKGLALCYMKKLMDNRGAYNNILGKWCEEGVEVGE